MNLTPREKDKLMVALAAHVARARLSRGLKLNYPESVALITDFVLEGTTGRRACDRAVAGRIPKNGAKSSVGDCL